MPALLTPPSPTAPRRVTFTRAQYYDMADRGYFDGKRVERLRGEIVEMSPINWPHTLAVGNTADELRRVFAGIGWVNEQNPLALTDSDPQPDVAVYPGRRRNFTAHPTAADALLVVEVADSSLDIDTTVKVELYAEDGIREFWVADLVKNRLLVFRDPGPITAGGHTYHTRLTLGPTDAVTPLAVPTQSVRVADLLP
jgi:Uma2 family endonuclease